VALLQAHREFEVVTPRTLGDFRGESLVFPEVSILSDEEKGATKAYVDRGGKLILLGGNATGIPASRVTVLSTDPGRTFYLALNKNFEGAAKAPPQELLRAVATKAEIEVDAPPTVAANFGLVNGAPHVFLANFTGLVPNKAAVPTPVSAIRVSINAAWGSALSFLPFLGETQVLRGEKKGNKMEFLLPPVERGAVIWVEGKS